MAADMSLTKKLHLRIAEETRVERNQSNVSVCALRFQPRVKFDLLILKLTGAVANDCVTYRRWLC